MGFFMKFLLCLLCALKEGGELIGKENQFHILFVQSERNHTKKKGGGDGQIHDTFR